MNDPWDKPQPVAKKAAAAAAAIGRAVDGVAEELALLKVQIALRNAEIERLQETCDQRQRVIDELTGHADMYRRAAEDRAELVASIDFELQQQRSELGRLESARDEAVAKADSALLALDEERARARKAIKEREAASRAGRRDAEAVRSRADVLEAALATRAALIDELQETCAERLAAMEQVSAEMESLRAVAEERGLLVETNEQNHRAQATLRAQELAAAQQAVGVLRERATMLESALTARSSLIDELQQACDERLAAIERLSGEIESLRTIAEERRLLVEANEQHYRAREAERAAINGRATRDDTDWRALADEREHALQELSAEAERRAVLLAELTAALEGRTREVEDLRKRLTRAS